MSGAHVRRHLLRRRTWDRRSPRLFALAVALGCVSLACQGTSNGEDTKAETPSAQHAAAPVQSGLELGSRTTAETPDPSETSPHDCSEHDGPRHAPTSATALTEAARRELTKLRVSAHVGGVTIRKHGTRWVLAGKRGCTVSPSRIKAALDNLMSLTAAPSAESLPVGRAFELQIDLLKGEEHALHFELAERRGGADLVRLLDDSVVTLEGLDRELWAADPAAWCGAPGAPTAAPSIARGGK